MHCPDTQHPRYCLQELCDFQPVTDIAGLAVFYHECSAGCNLTVRPGRSGENEDMIAHSSRRTYLKHVDITYINEPPSDQSPD